MTNPVVHGRNDRDRAYTVKATTAETDPTDQDVLLLDDVNARFIDKDERPVRVTSKTGAFDRIGERLRLLGDVVVVRGGQDRLFTDVAEMRRTPDGIAASGTADTRVETPRGAATSQGFETEPGLAKVRLTGPTRIELNGGVIE